MENLRKKLHTYLNVDLMLDQKQAEKIFEGLVDAPEQITDGWDMPKITIRFGKDIRCEKIEMPYKTGATFKCFLLNLGIDDHGALLKIA